MARCGPPKAMKTRLSRHDGIKVFDCVFNGAGPRGAFLTSQSLRHAAAAPHAYASDAAASLFFS